MRLVAGAARRSLVVGVLCALVGLTVDARADDLTMEQCVAANESAQVFRREGKLRTARVQLLICEAKSCPGPVRDDCAERLKDIERAAPTVVFVVKGATGIALTAVQITMDGARLADHLDGSALVVDPGEHTFKFVADGYTPVSKTLVIHERAKDRKEVATLESSAPHAESAPAPVTVAPTPVPGRAPLPEPPSPARPGDRRTLGYVLGGAGIFSAIVGTYFGIHAKSTYDDASSAANCPMGLSSCNQAGIDGVNSAHAQATVSTITFVLGGASLASGVVLFVTTPKAGAVSVQPSVGTASAGIRVGGGW